MKGCQCCEGALDRVLPDVVSLSAMPHDRGQFLDVLLRDLTLVFLFPQHFDYVLLRPEHLVRLTRIVGVVPDEGSDSQS